MATKINKMNYKIKFSLFNFLIIFLVCCSRNFVSEKSFIIEPCNCDSVKKQYLSLSDCSILDSIQLYFPDGYMHRNCYLDNKCLRTYIYRISQNTHIKHHLTGQYVGIVYSSKKQLKKDIRLWKRALHCN